MKTITIQLDNDLERTIDALSRQDGQEPTVVILDVIKRGLSETERREQAIKALDEVFAGSVSAPFSEMTEDEVIRTVGEEIAQERAEEADRLKRG